MKRTTSFLPFLSAASLALALATSASTARADAPTACDFPNDPSYSCFHSDPITLSKSSANIPFENGLNSGWLNCDGNPKTPCDQPPNAKCSTIGACLQIAMDKSKLDLSMQHNWDVYWPQVGKLQLVPRQPVNPGQAGKLSFTYELSPYFGIYLDVFNYKGHFAVDPLKILNAIDPSGTVTDFESSASGSCKFAPFAFDPPVVCPGQGKDGTVFKFDLSDIGIDIDKYVKIALGLTAGTTDVTFSWQTEQISVKGGDTPVNKTNPSTNIPYTGGGEVSAIVESKGTLSYKGSTYLAPTIYIEEIAGLPIKVTFPIDVGAQLPFEGKIPMSLNSSKLSILLPDLVLIPPLSTLNKGKPNEKTLVYFGEVAVGETVNKVIKYRNDGSMVSTGEISSSQGSIFKPKKAVFQLDPTKEDSFEVTFSPQKEGDIEATVFVKSNDPDQPEQSFIVFGTGKSNAVEVTGGSGGTGGTGGTGGAAGKAGSGGTGGKKTNFTPAAPEETSSDGGCGCRTAPSSESNLGGLALAALALVTVRRRRR